MARAVEEHLRRLPCQIFRVLRIALRGKLHILRAVPDALLIAVQRPFPTCPYVQHHVIAQRDRLLDRTDIVITVLTPGQHVQRQIELCKCTFRQNFHYLIFLPSR